MNNIVRLQLPDDFEQKCEAYLSVASSNSTPLTDLSRHNFLGLADVTLDIKERLEMSEKSEVWIPIIRNLIRFPEIYPVHSIRQMDDYGDTRSRALGYLKDHGYIAGYEFTGDTGHRWDTKVKISVNRLKFQEYYGIFKAVYAIKNINFPIDGSMQGSVASEASVNNPIPKFRFSEGVLFRDGSGHVLIFKSEDDQEYRLVRTAMALPLNERIDGMTDDLELNDRQIYDTARRLNQKIEAGWKITSFFEIDKTNKFVKRLVE